MQWQQVVQPIGAGADSNMKRRAVIKSFISAYQLLQISLWGEIFSDHSRPQEDHKGY